MTIPKWSNPSRRALLVDILTKHLSSLSGWKLDIETGAFYNPVYDEYIRTVIQYWQSSDREDTRLAWEAERKAMHSLGEHHAPTIGRWSNISQDVYHDSQPLYYLEALGIDAIRLRPFAKVKLASSYLRLFVDLSDSLKPLSKNKRHKVIRYGKPLPEEVQGRISEAIRLAVRDYLKH